MKTVDYSKFDQESRSQLQFIHLKEAIEELEKKLGYLTEDCKDWAANLISRVKELEGARIVQRQLNQQFLAEKPKELLISKKSFWDRFK